MPLKCEVMLHSCGKIQQDACPWEIRVVVRAGVLSSEAVVGPADCGQRLPEEVVRSDWRKVAGCGLIRVAVMLRGMVIASY